MWLTRSLFSLSSVLPACLFSVRPLSASCYLPLSVSYLCFESSSSRSGSSKKNKVIKLVDITDIQKVIAKKKVKSLTFFKEFPVKNVIMFFLTTPVQSAVSPARKWDGHLYSNSFYSEGTVWRDCCTRQPIKKTHRYYRLKSLKSFA